MRSTSVALHAVLAVSLTLFVIGCSKTKTDAPGVAYQPDPSGDSPAVAVSPDPAPPIAKAGYQPDPTGDSPAVAVNPDPAPPIAKAGYQPDPSGDSPALAKGGDPLGGQEINTPPDPIRPGYQPDPTGDGAQLAYQPDPTGDNSFAYQPDPTGDAPALAAGAGGSNATATLWRALSRHQATHLADLDSDFGNPKPEAREVLDAFKALAGGVTGPTGFWRVMVPQQWLGCATAPGSAPCQALTKAGPELASWDAFVAAIDAVPAGQEQQFLATHQAKMSGYIAAFVPPSKDLAGMKATGFYGARLAPAFGGTVTGQE